MTVVSYGFSVRRIWVWFAGGEEEKKRRLCCRYEPLWLVVVVRTAYDGRGLVWPVVVSGEGERLRGTFQLSAPFTIMDV